MAWKESEQFAIPDFVKQKIPSTGEDQRNIKIGNNKMYFEDSDFWNICFSANFSFFEDRYKAMNLIRKVNFFFGTDTKMW